MTLNDYRKLEKQLRAEELYGTDVELVAVTVDPKVDTQKVLKKYASNFEANAEGWKVLTGDDVVIDRLTRQLNFYYSKAESGLVTHGTQMFILDRDNKVRAISSMAKTTDEPVDLEEVMTSVKQLAKE
ncbi:SCO family protein [Exiguobacterium artemiae]